MKKKINKYKVIGMFRKEYNSGKWSYTTQVGSIGSFHGNIDRLKNEVRRLQENFMVIGSFHGNSTQNMIENRPVVDIINLTTGKRAFYRVVENNNVIEIDEDEVLFLCI